MKHKLLYYGVIPALGLQLVAAALYFGVGRDSEYVGLIYTLSKIFIFTWPLWWWRQRSQLPKTMVSHQVRNSGLGLIAGGVNIMVIVLLAKLLWSDISVQADNVRELVQQFGLGSLSYYIGFAIFISFIHSGLEEYYWRWFVYGGLRSKVSPLVAAGISSLGFASHHWLIINGLAGPKLATIGTGLVFVAGLSWCWLYQKTGRLSTSWISHLGSDLALMLLGYYLIF